MYVRAMHLVCVRLQFLKTYLYIFIEFAMHIIIFCDVLVIVVFIGERLYNKIQLTFG